MMTYKNHINSMGGGHSKTEYSKPSLSILNFKLEDIITKSGCTDCSGDGKPETNGFQLVQDTCYDNTYDAIE